MAVDLLVWLPVSWPSRAGPPSRGGGSLCDTQRSRGRWRVSSPPVRFSRTRRSWSAAALSLTELRPEGLAPTCRAVVLHALELDFLRCVVALCRACLDVDAEDVADGPRHRVRRQAGVDVDGERERVRGGRRELDVVARGDREIREQREAGAGARGPGPPGSGGPAGACRRACRDDVSTLSSRRSPSSSTSNAAGTPSRSVSSPAPADPFDRHATRPRTRAPTGMPLRARAVRPLSSTRLGARARP
jgi:hypothetical protein